MACKNCNPCTDLGCKNIVYPECIVTKVAYPCIGTTAGKTGEDVFAAINSALCSLGSNSCTPVFAEDGKTTSTQVTNASGICSGYQVGIAPVLITQINNNTTNITNITNSLVLVWNDVTLLNGFVNQGGLTQTAQYTDPSNSVVRLRGAIESPDYTAGDVICTLPEAPLAYRTFSTVIFVQNLLSYTFGIITVDTSGNCTIAYQGYTVHDQIRVYLDGISFEIN